MTEHRQPTTTPDTPRSFGWCAWHQGNAAGVRVIYVIEHGSGPGGATMACPPCMTAHQLTPLADRP